MAQEPLLKGSALAGYARKKAAGLGLDGKGVKLDELVPLIQKTEGHEPCFRQKEQCDQLACCWQLSCGAEMLK